MDVVSSLGVAMWGEGYTNLAADIEEEITLYEKAVTWKVRTKWPEAAGVFTKFSDRMPNNVLWNLEAIGTPEANQLVSDLQQAGFPFQPSEVRIFDLDFHNYRDLLASRKVPSLRLAEDYKYKIGTEKKHGKKYHGMAVAHLIAGTDPLPGVSSNAKISLLSDIDYNDYGGDYSPVEQYLDVPGIINISLALRIVGSFAFKHKEIFRKSIFLPLIGKKTLVVAAAGNKFPHHDEQAANGLSQEKYGAPRVIMVGSSDPDGFVSCFSSPGDCVVVTAPSSRNITFSYNGHYSVLFGGTSGAAPLVSGVLADVRSILPELTIESAVALLQGTAIKTATNEVSDLNGAGVLNHYKMLRVALRLAADGYDGEKMPTDISSYLDFSDEVASLAFATSDTLPGGESFFNLRKSFFLAPNNEEVRRLLASYYRHEALLGQERQDLFYDSPSLALKDKSIQMKLDNRVRAWLNRFSDTISFFSEEILVIKGVRDKLAEQGLSRHAVTKQLLRVAEDVEYAAEDTYEREIKPLVGEALQEVDSARKRIQNIIDEENPIQPYTDREIYKQLKREGVKVKKNEIGLYLQLLGGDMIMKERRNNAIGNAILEIVGGEDPDKPYTDKEISGLLKARGIELSDSRVGEYRRMYALLRGSSHRKIVYDKIKRLADNVAFADTYSTDNNVGMELVVELAKMYDRTSINSYWQNYFLQNVLQKLLSKEEEFFSIGVFPHEELPDYFQYLRSMKTNGAVAALHSLLERYRLLKDIGLDENKNEEHLLLFLGLVFYNKLYLRDKPHVEKVLAAILEHAIANKELLEKKEELREIIVEIMQKVSQEVNDKTGKLYSDFDLNIAIIELSTIKMKRTESLVSLRDLAREVGDKISHNKFFNDGGFLKKE